MKTTDDSKGRFLFSASSAGLSANLSSPIKRVQVKGQSVLQGCPGYSSDSSDGFSIEEIVRVGSISVQVSGIESQAGAWESLAISTVEDLDILGIVKADRIVARVTHRVPLKGGEPSISFLGSRFEGLSIAGRPVDFPSDNTFSPSQTVSELSGKLAPSYRTFAEAVQGLKSDTDDDARIVGRLRAYSPIPLVDQTGAKPVTGRPFAGSLAQGFNFDVEGCRRCGHVIYVPNFGVIVLAEFLVDANSASINMLQVDLGSPVEGFMCAGSGRGGGTPMPGPQPGS